mgnify:CR=1 FL=1
MLPPEVTAASDKSVAGRTTMLVRHGQRFLGVIAVMERPQPLAAQVMAELRTFGIKRLTMSRATTSRWPRRSPRAWA